MIESSLRLRSTMIHNSFSTNYRLDTEFDIRVRATDTRRSLACPHLESPITTASREILRCLCQRVWDNRRANYFRGKRGLLLGTTPGEFRFQRLENTAPLTYRRRNLVSSWCLWMLTRDALINSIYRMRDEVRHYNKNASVTSLYNFIS